MKKTLFVISIIVTLVFGTKFTFAQQGNPYQCDAITTDAEYSRCCSGEQSYRVNELICSDYLDAKHIQGGTPPVVNTNPVTPQTQGTITTTTQTGTVELKQCSKISFDSLLDILIWARCIISVAVIPLLFTLAFLFFLWGMINYIRNADNEAKREESKRFIYWGILGLTVMVSVWGIVRIVTSTFGLGNTVPQLQTKDDCLTTSKNNPCKN